MLGRQLATAAAAAFLTQGGAVLAMTLSAPLAAADLDPGCEEVDRGDGRVVIICQDDGSADGGDGGGDGSGGGDGGSSRTCEWVWEIPCVDETGGVWNGQCYVKALDPQPDYDEPIWDGRTEGVIVMCYEPQSTPGISYNVIWVPYIPGVDSGPDPEALAREAIVAMQLTAGAIGTTPPGPAVGVLGLPTWLWVDDPGESTTGPITRSVSSSGLSVTATASLQQIVYAMGDGATVRCEGANAAGTPYTTSAGSSPSPTCGHTYSSAGEYTITATSTWVVEWSGGGQTGTIPMELTASVGHEVGEVQTVVTGD